MLPLGWPAIRLFRLILAVPREVLMPLILVFCVVGSFAINNSVFGVGIMLVMGSSATSWRRTASRWRPAILGLVLGGMIEANFLTSMMKADGAPRAFFARRVAAVLGCVTIAFWSWVAVGHLLRARPSRGVGRARILSRPRGGLMPRRRTNGREARG